MGNQWGRKEKKGRPTCLLTFPPRMSKPSISRFYSQQKEASKLASKVSRLLRTLPQQRMHLQTSPYGLDSEQPHFPAPNERILLRLANLPPRLECSFLLGKDNMFNDVPVGHECALRGRGGGQKIWSLNRVKIIKKQLKQPKVLTPRESVGAQTNETDIGNCIGSCEAAEFVLEVAKCSLPPQMTVAWHTSKRMKERRERRERRGWKAGGKQGTAKSRMEIEIPPSAWSHLR